MEGAEADGAVDVLGAPAEIRQEQPLKACLLPEPRSSRDPADNRIAVHPFLLDKMSAKKPSRFEFELLIDEVVYAFSFVVTRRLEERLAKVGSTTRAHYTIVDMAKSNLILGGRSEVSGVRFPGYRDNQLFLTNSVSQNMQQFDHPCWFKNTLQLIEPDARFEGGGLRRQSACVNEMLRNLDTGISHIGTERVPFEGNQIPDADGN